MAGVVDTGSCEAHRSKGYECVPFYECEEGENDADDDSAITNSKCPDYLYECCRKQDIVASTDS